MCSRTVGFFWGRIPYPRPFLHVFNGPRVKELKVPTVGWEGDIWSVIVLKSCCDHSEIYMYIVINEGPVEVEIELKNKPDVKTEES